MTLKTAIEAVVVAGAIGGVIGAVRAILGYVDEEDEFDRNRLHTLPAKRENK